MDIDQFRYYIKLIKILNNLYSKIHSFFEKVNLYALQFVFL